jgi:hypothetical protein
MLTAGLPYPNALIWVRLQYNVKNVCSISPGVYGLGNLAGDQRLGTPTAKITANNLIRRPVSAINRR